MSKTNRKVHKVLVLGAGEAGKSTLMTALCERAVNLEVGGRTVAMDHGMIRRDGRSISMVGLPGQERFAGVREALLSGSAAAVWVLRASVGPDATSVELLRQLQVPYLVLINQRIGEEAGPPFEPLNGLPVPSAVLDGNLVNPADGFLQTLENAIWDLVND